jgi:phospholipase/carboxylesterase
VNRRHWLTLTLSLLAGASLAYVQPWQPRLVLLRVGGKGPPNLMLLHGDGSSPAHLLRDTRSIGFPAEGRVLFPQGPDASSREHGLPDGRTWWDLDLTLYRRREQPGVDLTSIDPRGLQRAARLVGNTLDREGNSAAHPFVLGGFGQGAMVACEVAFNSDEPLSGLVLLSGAYVDSTGWGWKSPKRRRLPVFIAHGRQDDVYPFDQAERLWHALEKGQDDGNGGVDVTFVPFDGGHEITAEVQMALAIFLAQIRQAGWRKQSGLAGDTLAPPAPSNVRDLPDFPDGLPTCDSNVKRGATAPLNPALELVGKKVTFTGTLSLGRRRTCTLMGCPGGCCNTCAIGWQVAGFGSSDATISLHRSLIWKECERAPSSIEIPVVATGSLVVNALAMIGETPRFSLAQANLCTTGPRR